jgi:hypothetical protein
MPSVYKKTKISGASRHSTYKDIYPAKQKKKMKIQRSWKGKKEGK